MVPKLRLSLKRFFQPLLSIMASPAPRSIFRDVLVDITMYEHLVIASALSCSPNSLVLNLKIIPLSSYGYTNPKAVRSTNFWLLSSPALTRPEQSSFVWSARVQDRPSETLKSNKNPRLRIKQSLLPCGTLVRNPSTTA